MGQEHDERKRYFISFLCSKPKRTIRLISRLGSWSLIELIMGSFREEFMRTESSLARHPAGIKERLIDAAIAGIAHLSTNQHELDKMPEELRTQFLDFMQKLTRAGGSAVPGEGSIHGTVREMSVDEAQMMVDEFLALSHEIRNFPR